MSAQCSLKIGLQTVPPFPMTSATTVRSGKPRGRPKLAAAADQAGDKFLFKCHECLVTIRHFPPLTSFALQAPQAVQSSILKHTCLFTEF